MSLELEVQRIRNLMSLSRLKEQRETLLRSLEEVESKIAAIEETVANDTQSYYIENFESLRNLHRKGAIKLEVNVK